MGEGIFTAVVLGLGLSYTIAQALIILRGFRDKTYGMPLVALCANLSWEFIFSVIIPPDIPYLPILSLVWSVSYLILLFQVLKYGPREFPELPRGAFYTIVALALVTSFCTVLFVSLEFDDSDGAYAAFGQNLLMSALFVTMLLQRRSLRGQSIQIAFFKMLGTALHLVAFFVSTHEGSTLIPFLGVAALVFDFLYIGMVSYMRSRNHAPYERRHSTSQWVPTRQ